MLNLKDAHIAVSLRGFDDLAIFVMYKDLFCQKKQGAKQMYGGGHENESPTAIQPFFGFCTKYAQSFSSAY